MTIRAPDPRVDAVERVVLPAVAQAEGEFAAALARISVEDLAVRAQGASA